MRSRDTAQESDFREEIRNWLAENLDAEFIRTGKAAGLASGGTWDVQLAWERKLGEGRWIGLGWPKEYGGRGASVAEQVIFNVECARAGTPARVNLAGEFLLGPTLIRYGTDEQRRRFLPEILAATELWCQGYSEPGAGSDLAAVSTRAHLEGDEWIVTGQKVWTTYGHWADWCFVVCRTDPESFRHQGLSYLLVPMDQPGVEARPLKQMTGTSEFSEVFFDGARTTADMVVGRPGDGWAVAMATLGFERGTASLSQQLSFEREFWGVVDEARSNGSLGSESIRDRLAAAYIGVQVMGYNAARSLERIVTSGEIGPESSIGKLYWSEWHRDLGELAMEILGPAGQIVAGADYGLNPAQWMFLFSRAETIYAGASEIQRNIIAERVLGLPREPRQGA